MKLYEDAARMKANIGDLWRKGLQVLLQADREILN